MKQTSENDDNDRNEEYEWLPDCFYNDNNQQNFVNELLNSAKISKIAFIRHGNTNRATTTDYDRTLTNLGRSQAREAGRTYGSSILHPLHRLALVSPAPRTTETARLIFEETTMAEKEVGGGSNNVPSIIPVSSLYDAVIQPEGSELSRKLGYASLAAYVHIEEPDDRRLARRILGSYAKMVYDAILDTVKQDETTTKVSSSTTTTLCIVGHAVYLPAAAYGVATLVGCDEQSKDMICKSVTSEAEGYCIDIPNTKAEYLKRPSSLAS